MSESKEAEKQGTAQGIRKAKAQSAGLRDWAGGYAPTRFSHIYKAPAS
jgi:hypothetical protein